VGNDQGEHIFALTQSLALYDTHQAMMADCAAKLEAAIAALTIKASSPIAPLPKARLKGRQVNAPSFDVRAALHGVLGVDLTQIHGLGPSLAPKLVAECGTHLKAYPGAKHFTSWLCLAPGNKISCGKLLSSRTRPSSSRSAAQLRLAAVTIGRSDTALGAFYRRLRRTPSKLCSRQSPPACQVTRIHLGPGIKRSGCFLGMLIHLASPI
jgi:transposase